MTRKREHRRSRWVRVSDLLLDKPWTNDQLAAVVRLLCFMRQRWAREHLSPEDGCRVTIGPLDAMKITGKGRPDIAATSLGHLVDIASISAERRGNIVSIDWPNVADFQEWEGLEAGSARAPGGRSGSRLPTHVEQTPSESEAASAASLERALRILAKEPGSPETKRAWMERELPLLLAESERQEPADKRARSAAFRSNAIRYWRQHQNGGRLNGARSRPEVGTSPLAERARAILREARARAGDGSG